MTRSHRCAHRPGIRLEFHPVLNVARAVERIRSNSSMMPSSMSPGSGRHGKVAMVTLKSILRTRYVLDEHGRMRSTREPEPGPAPLFTLIRSASSCAWAVRADVPREPAAELDRLASEESPIQDPLDAPLHADRYLSLVGGQTGSGPTFARAPDDPVKMMQDLWLRRRIYRLD